jgi:hypothetical protein
MPPVCTDGGGPPMRNARSPVRIRSRNAAPPTTQAEGGTPAQKAYVKGEDRCTGRARDEVC